MVHGARNAETIDAIERAADDVLNPLVGTTFRSALEVPRRVEGFQLTGTGLAFSAAKESEDGVWVVLRCVNLLDEDVNGEWCVPFDIVEARLARLDETLIAELEVIGRTVTFHAKPHAIITVLAR